MVELPLGRSKDFGIAAAPIRMQVDIAHLGVDWIRFPQENTAQYTALSPIADSISNTVGVSIIF